MQYQSYAAEYAGVNPKNKNHKYWVDIGNYINQEQVSYKKITIKNLFK